MGSMGKEKVMWRETPNKAGFVEAPAENGPRPESRLEKRPGSSLFKPLLDNFFSSQRPFFSLSQRVWNPPADVYETRESIVIKMEIAGVCQNRLEVKAENHWLIIRGVREEDPFLQKEDYHLMEVRYGQFERVFSLPFKLREEDIQARYEQGFLMVTVEKQPLDTRKINVEVVDPE